MDFYKNFIELKEKLEKMGHKIILPLPDETYSKDKNVKNTSMKDFNKNLEKSDAILVANFKKNSQEDYIGINSIMEIGIAFNRNKKVFILNKIPKNCEEELKAINCIALKKDLSKIK